MKKIMLQQPQGLQVKDLCRGQVKGSVFALVGVVGWFGRLVGGFGCWSVCWLVVVEVCWLMSAKCQLGVGWESNRCPLFLIGCRLDVDVESVCHSLGSPMLWGGVGASFDPTSRSHKVVPEHEINIIFDASYEFRCLLDCFSVVLW